MSDPVDRSRLEPPSLFAVPDPLSPGYVCRSAIISKDEQYRYSLSRWWDNSKPHDLWIMCNPSTADEGLDDNTIRRCIGFSKTFGAGGFTVVNCYGYRATDPDAMRAAQKAGVDIIGPETDGWLRAHLMTITGRVIVAWGRHPKPARAAEVAAVVSELGREPLCLGVTKDGQPRHPLMLASTTPLRPFVLGRTTQ